MNNPLSTSTPNTITSLSTYNVSLSFRPIEFFRPLQIRDSHLRSIAINTVIEKLIRMEKEDKSILLHFIPTAARIVDECPFEDVRNALSTYLDHIKTDLLINIPTLPSASNFIPSSELIPKYTTNEKYKRLFEWSFITYGRVSNITTVLAYHPTYLECFLQTYSVLLYDEGPLPVPWRAYLSILASSRHGCTYYIRRQQDTFLSHGGDPSWLLGLNHPNVPPEIVAIAELNALLAHRPWMITVQHIKALTSGDNGWSWSVNELVHAIVILAAFHSSCSLIQACGICRESDNGILLGLHPIRANIVSNIKDDNHDSEIDKHNDNKSQELSNVITNTANPTTITNNDPTSSTISTLGLSGIRISTNITTSATTPSTLSSLPIHSDADKEAELRSRLLQTGTHGDIDYDRFTEIGIDDNSLNVLEDTKSIANNSYLSGSRNSDSKKNKTNNQSILHNRKLEATNQNIGGWDLSSGNNHDDDDDEEEDYDDEDDDEYDEDDDDLVSELDFERAGLGGGLLSGIDNNGLPLDMDSNTPLPGSENINDSLTKNNIFAPIIENGLDGANYRGKGIIRYVQESEKILALQKAYLAAYTSGVPLTPRTSTGPAGLVLSQKDRRRTFRNAQRDKERLANDIVSMNKGLDVVKEEDDDEKMKKETNEENTNANTGADGHINSDIPTSLPNSENQGSTITTTTNNNNSSSTTNISSSPYALHIESLRYRDFDTSENGLITHDFSWEEHGYSLIARFHPSAAPALDRQFTTAYQLTYGKLGSSGEIINTEKLRTAIWYYIQRLFGVRNDHYDYALVNRFMTISTKTFAKKVACAPETITANDFSSFSTMFTIDEKVHIALLAAEARRQAALLWGLSAVMKHMTGGANK